MVLVEDGGQFDEMQATLIGSLIESIKEELESEKLNPELTRELLEKISFSLAVILDGSRDATFSGKEAYPIITFENKNGDLIFGGGNTWMHEYVFGIISQIYGE